MSYDGIVTRAIVDELNKTITGGKISKINQPSDNEINLIVYNNKKNYKVLLNASSNLARVYITDISKQNPLAAPNFCMFLRKYLQGGIIKSVRQNGIDRVIFIDIKTYDELSFEVDRTLVIELMGKYSNIILINKEDNKILESINHVTLDMSRVRQVYPGTVYKLIEDSKKDITIDRVLPSDIIKQLEKPNKLFKFFYQNYTGFSPTIGKEICFKANLDFDRLTNDLSDEELSILDNVFIDLTDKILNHDYKPSIQKNTHNNNYKDFHVLDIEFLGGNNEYFENISSMLERYYMVTATQDKVYQKSNDIKKIVSTKLNRDRNKLVNLYNELELSEDRDKYKVYGDLLSANIHLIERGKDKIIVENFYDENLKKIEIPISIKKSPWDNAQNYYKKYSKLKVANKLLKVQIPELKDEIKYLEQILDSIERVTETSEIEEIKEELRTMGLIKKKTKKQRKDKPSKPYHYKTSNGLDVYVGKNNAQNDRLTLKVANKDDYFLHAKDIAGSHVILRNNNDVTEKDILEAAFLAGYYSKASNEDYIDVDCTQKKNVRKAKQAKPGMVYYDNFDTYHIDLKALSINDFEKINN